MVDSSLLISISQIEGAIKQAKDAFLGSEVSSIGQNFGIDTSNKPLLIAQLEGLLTPLRQEQEIQRGEESTLTGLSLPTQLTQNSTLRNVIIIGAVIAGASLLFSRRKKK